MRFEDLPTAQKGDMGEALVDDYLLRQRHIPFKGVAHGRHGFDRVCVKRDGGMFIYDVKTKPCRLFYPDTGINRACYDEYRAASEHCGVRFFLFFVCEQHAMIHGNWLDKLDEPREIVTGRKVGGGATALQYPFEEKTGRGHIRYFPTRSLYSLERIESARLVRLQEQTTRRYDYSWRVVS